MVVRPHILQGAPSSTFAKPPQLPDIGLFFTITPIAIAANEIVIKKKTVRNSITIIPVFRFHYNIIFFD
jgi:hypothetical protein|tara:strand:+ start:466 stop:672 length:207 start_codon:yes stop_codon:yes gene_type:complete